MVQSGGFSANDFREVFKRHIEKRVRSLPEIDGLSKETVLSSWMAKFDTIYRGDEDPRKAQQRMTASAASELILSKDQLYEMFQNILGIKKFEHQLLYQACQVSFSSLLVKCLRGFLHLAPTVRSVCTYAHTHILSKRDQWHFCEKCHFLFTTLDPLCSTENTTSDFRPPWLLQVLEFAWSLIPFEVDLSVDALIWYDASLLALTKALLSRWGINHLAMINSIQLIWQCQRKFIISADSCINSANQTLTSCYLP